MTEEENILLDRYLREELSPDERASFQVRLENDPVLREQLALRKSLYSFISSEESELRELLTIIDEEQNDEPVKTTSFSWKWIAGLLLLLIVLLYFLLSDRTSTPSVPAEELTVQPPLTSPEVITPVTEDSLLSFPAIEPSPTAPAAAPSVPKQRPKPAPSKQVPPKPAPPASPVYAQLDVADFTPGGSLEELVRTELRSVDSSAITWPNFPDTMRLSGSKVLTLFTTVAPPHSLLIFSNKESDFIDDLPLVRDTLNSPEYADGYRSVYEADALQTPGLYYVLLFDKTEEILAATRLLAH